MFKRGIVILLLPLLASCSSVTKSQYYSFDPVSDLGALKVYKDENGRSTGFLYRQGKDSGDHESIWIEVENTGETLYTFGPMFLPVIPVFFFPSSRRPIDSSKQIEIKFLAYSNADFGPSIKTLPELMVELPDGKKLKAIKTSPCLGDKDRCVLFTYDAKVGQTREFYISETRTILSDGRELRTPRLRYNFNDRIHFHWFQSIAP